MSALPRRGLDTGRDLFMHSFTQGYCEEFLGNILGHRSWMYDLQGCVIHGGDEQAGEDRKLSAYTMENWHGCLFVNLDGQAPPYAPNLAGMLPGLKKYQLDQLKLIRQPTVFEMEANWKLMAENYIEAFHHLATHRNSFEKVSPARTTTTDELRDAVITLRMPIKNDFETARGWTLPPVSPCQTKTWIPSWFICPYRCSC